MELKEIFLQETLALIQYSVSMVIYHKFNLQVVVISVVKGTIFQQLFVVEIFKKKNWQKLILEGVLDKPPEFLD